MQCDEIKKLLPSFLDDELESEERTNIQVHLSSCVNCQNELKAYRRSWELLKQWPDVEPQLGYVSRFWTQLAHEHTPWYQEALVSIYSFVRQKRFLPVFAAVSVFLIVGAFSLPIFVSDSTNGHWTNFSSEDLELCENLDFAENLSIIEDLEFFEDMDVIEQISPAEA